MTVTANDAYVLRAAIDEPRFGLWLADIEVDAPEALMGDVLLSFDEGAVEFHGTALPARSGMKSTRAVARLVGGRAGLRELVEACYYRGAPARLIVEQLLEEVGEALAPDSDVLDGLLPSWTRVASTAGRALTTLCQHLGLSWRVTRAGEVWVGTEPWPALTADYTRGKPAPQRDALMIAPHGPPVVRPGVVFEDRRVSHVHTAVTGRGIRQELLFE